MLGDYDGNLGRRIHRPVRRRAPLPADMPDEPTAAVIRRAAQENPGATDAEVFLVIQQTEPEGPTLAQVRAALWNK